MSDCIFCKIIQGEIPSAKVYEDENLLAFLDITQVTPGHTLVIPKKHVQDIYAYDDEIASLIAKKLPVIARAIKEAFPDCKGINILNNNEPTAYQSVFHTHWHIIPRYHAEDGLGIVFTDHSKDYSQEEFQERAQRINQQIKP